MLEKYHRDEKLPQGCPAQTSPAFATRSVYANLPQQRLGYSPQVCKEIRLTCFKAQPLAKGVGFGFLWRWLATDLQKKCLFRE